MLERRSLLSIARKPRFPVDPSTERKIDIGSDDPIPILRSPRLILARADGFSSSEPLEARLADRAFEELRELFGLHCLGYDPEDFVGRLEIAAHQLGGMSN